MYNAAQKTKPLGGIVAVSANVILRDLCILGKKAVHAPRFGEDIGCVAKLWGLDHDSILNVKDVFVAEQIDPACAAGELAIKERVVIGTPADLRDIKVAGNTQIGAQSLQLRSLDG